MNSNLQTPVPAPVIPPVEDDEIEIDLAELFSYYLSKWYLLFLGLIIGTVAAGLFTYFMITPKFTATSKLYMVSSSSNTIVDLTDLNIGTSLTSDYTELIKTRPILEDIIAENELTYDVAQLRGMISISSVSNTRILAISVTSTSPTEAATVANALADKAVESIPVLMDTSTPNIAERAIVPESKSSPSMKKNAAIGGILGLFLVAAVLTLLFLMEDTMSTAEDVQKKLGLMPLTVVPEGDISGSYDTVDDSRKRKHRRRAKA